MWHDKLIVTDCDGVLLDWEAAFHAWMERHGYERMPGVEQVSYSMSPLYGLEVAEIKQQIRQFNESAGIAFLKPLEHAVEFVRILKYNHGYNFEVVTSLGDWEPSVELRKFNLEQVFGNDIFDEIFCLPIGDPKYDFLKGRYGSNSGAIWVEDKPENAEDGASLGMRTFLINQTHNASYKPERSMERVNDWIGIYESLLLNNR